jgi:NTE family protein
MKKCTAFVLGGGGSHGAFQVGALRALLEAGITPDLLVGTSIGAVNATGLALWGVDKRGMDSLEQTWHKVAGIHMLDPRVNWLLMRSMLGRTSDLARRKVEGFCESLGLTRSLRFSDIRGVRLGLVSADIAAGRPVIYGMETDDPVLEGLLASIAVPPWFAPFHKNARVMVDGGALSNLPIEPAMQMGATEIVALDLDVPLFSGPEVNLTVLQYMGEFLHAITQRTAFLETSLAESQGIPVRRIEFGGMAGDPIWDFSNYRALIQAGYEQTVRQIGEWRSKSGREDIFPDRRTEHPRRFPKGVFSRIRLASAPDAEEAPRPSPLKRGENR